MCSRVEVWKCSGAFAHVDVFPGRREGKQCLRRTWGWGHLSAHPGSRLALVTPQDSGYGGQGLCFQLWTWRWERAWLKGAARAQAPRVTWPTLQAHQAYALGPAWSCVVGPAVPCLRVVGWRLRRFGPQVGGWDRAAPSRLVQPGPRDCPANPLEGGYGRPDRRAQGLQRGDPPGRMHWLPAGNRGTVAGVLLITLTGWGLGLPEPVRDRARQHQRIPIGL